MTNRRRSIWLVVVVSLVLSLQPAAGSATEPDILIGAYNHIWSDRLGSSDVSLWLPGEQDMEAWLEREHAVVNLYAGTGDDNGLLIETLEAIWDADSIPMLSYAIGSSNSFNARVASGLEDARIDSLASSLVGFLAGDDATYNTADDRRIYFRPDWEANGDWYGYSPNYDDPIFGHPGDLQFDSNVSNFKSKWQRVHSRFAAAGLDSNHLAWIYSVNFTDSFRWDSSTSSAVQIADILYPGDSYVDFIGIDGYSGSATPMASPSDVFDSMLNRLRAISSDKPVAITEVGVSTTSSGVTGKSGWITDYFEWLDSQSDVRMSIWFNADVDDDYAVFGGSDGDGTFVGAKTYNVYGDYRAEIQSRTNLIGPDTGNSRLVSDTVFLGQ